MVHGERRGAGPSLRQAAAPAREGVRAPEPPTLPTRPAPTRQHHHPVLSGGRVAVDGWRVAPQQADRGVQPLLPGVWGCGRGARLRAGGGRGAGAAAGLARRRLWQAALLHATQQLHTWPSSRGRPASRPPPTPRHSPAPCHPPGSRYHPPSTHPHHPRIHYLWPAAHQQPCPPHMALNTSALPPANPPGSWCLPRWPAGRSPP